jgi:hypothetical protein
MHVLTFSEVLSAFALRALILRSEDAPPVPADDPTRDPNWCHTHGQMWPACAPQHEEQS